MNVLHLPWLELMLLWPALGAMALFWITDARRAQRLAVVASGLSLACALGAWQDLNWLHATAAIDRWDLCRYCLGHEWLVVDDVSAPLLPAISLLYFLTLLATPGTKIRRFSWQRSLGLESLTLLAFSCREPWLLIACLALMTIPAWRELKARGRPRRVYGLHMELAFVCLIGGQWLYGVSSNLPTAVTGASITLAVSLLMIAVLILSGMAPFHCWLTELFEHASFGMALLTIAPLSGAYAAMRLLLPIASDSLLRAMGLVALATALYAAAMTLIQRDIRRLFCYLFLSHAALVLVGLELVTPIGVTGGLCVWLSVTIALTGFGLTLRALEARFGRIQLHHPLGYYEHTPTIALCFLLTGLASVGFPGTIGFIGMELLIDGAVGSNPYVGVAVVVAGMLNGIAIIRSYFRLFGGPRHESSIHLGINKRERFAVLILIALVIGGGLLPGPGITSRHHAAEHILTARRSQLQQIPHHGHPAESATPNFVDRDSGRNQSRVDAESTEPIKPAKKPISLRLHEIGLQDRYAPDRD